MKKTTRLECLLRIGSNNTQAILETNTGIFLVKFCQKKQEILNLTPNKRGKKAIIDKGKIGK
jgi:hypothetical protein